MKNYISCKNLKCIHNKGFGGCAIIPSLTKNGECLFFTDKVTPKLEITPTLEPMRVTKEAFAILKNRGEIVVDIENGLFDNYGRRVEIIE